MSVQSFFPESAYVAQFQGASSILNRLASQLVLDSERMRFAHLAHDWKEQTRNSSSVTDALDDGAYRQIIGMGQIVVPWIIDELVRDGGGLWSPALSALTGEAIPQTERYDIVATTNFWIDWYRNRGSCVVSAVP